MNIQCHFPHDDWAYIDTLIDIWYVNILLHAVIIVNSYFLINGEKYYNEDVGAE